MIFKILAPLSLVLPLAMYGQLNGSTAPDYFQINYAANLSHGDGVVNLTNNGSSAGSTPGVNSAVGAICVNVYGFVPDEQQAVCCSCYVSPNALKSLSVVFGPNALFANPLTAAERNPDSVVIKLIAQRPTGYNSCANAADATRANLVPGMRAWGTRTHPTNTGTYSVTETAFSNSDLSDGELAFITFGCNAIRQIGSGSGVCAGCQLGGLTAADNALSTKLE